MTTIDDKLKLFAKIVFEKIEKDSEEKVSEFSISQDRLLETEKNKIFEESKNLIEDSRKKALDMKKQIISKVNIEAQHTVLKKRKEIYDRTVEDIKALTVSFTESPEYIPFLEKSINMGLSRFKGGEVNAFFRAYDVQKYGNEINQSISRFKMPNTVIYIKETHEEILGGCIFENIDSTMRADCSMAAVLDDNKKMIGKLLMDNLQ